MSPGSNKLPGLFYGKIIENGKDNIKGRRRNRWKTAKASMWKKDFISPF